MKFLRIPDFKQSGKDVYTDKKVKTVCSPDDFIAMKIHAIELFWVPASFINGSWMEITLQSEEGQQVGGISNKSVLAHWEIMCRFSKHGGGWQIIAPIKNVFNPPVLYAGEFLYMALNSCATGVKNIGNGRIHYTLETLNERQYNEALEQFLESIRK